MKLGKNIVAIVLCAVMVTVIGGIYLYEKNRQMFNNAVYEQVIPEFEKQQQELSPAYHFFIFHQNFHHPYLHRGAFPQRLVPLPFA